MNKGNVNRDGYKETKLGWIPNDWEIIKLINACSEGGKYGASLSAIPYSPQKPRYVRITDISKEGNLIDEVKKSIPNNKANGYLLKKGDFLFARTGATVGKTYLYKEEDGLCAYAGYLIRFVPIPTLLNPKYLAYYTQTARYWYWVSTILRIGAQPNINAQEYSSLNLILPPIEEQVKIAEILTTWDKAIELVGLQIEAKQKLKKALMQQLLTGKKRFSDFDDEWSSFYLKDILISSARKMKKPSNSYLRVGIRSHGKGTFNTFIEDPNKVDMTHLYQVREGDLILNITFAWEGAIALAEKKDDYGFVSHRFPTYGFKKSRIHPYYFKYYMTTSRFFYDLGVVSPGGAGRNRVLNKKSFLKLPIEIPSLNEQKKISEILLNIDNEIELLKNKRKDLNKQKQGLMQKLLTGEVRVKIEEEIL